MNGKVLFRISVNYSSSWDLSHLEETRYFDSIQGIHNLIVPDLPWYNEDGLFLVVSDHKNREWVPVQLGILVRGELVATMISEELQQAGKTWKQVHLCNILSKGNVVESPGIPKYDLKGVKGKLGQYRR